MRFFFLGFLFLSAACQRDAAPAPLPQQKQAQSTPSSAPSNGLTEQSARVLLEQQADKMRACFSSEARWSLSVSLRVEPTGAVSSASVFDLLRDSAVATCAEDVLRSVKFPSFSGDAVRVSYSYSLRAVVEPIGASSVPVPAAKSQPTSQISVPVEASDALLQAEKLFALGELEKAQQTLMPFVDKPLPEMLYLLAGISAQRGQVNEMCAYYRRYLVASPQSPAAPGVQRQIDALCK